MPHAPARSAIPRPAPRRRGPLRRLISDAIARPGFALSRLPGLGELVAAATPAQRPPILIVSLPRCGSSWVGTIVGGAESALYLREPVTQSYKRWIGEPTRAVFDPATCKDIRSYDRFASRAFRGVPRFPGKIVQDPSRWTPFDRSSKRVVVKEVNPLAIERWWKAFQPTVVFLVRHPVAVTRSRQAMGRTEENPAGVDSGSPWEEGGAFQATVQNRAMDFLRRIDHAVVRYEDLCADPLGEFGKIFDYCGLELSASVRQEIERSSRSDARYVPGQYDTARDSRRMRERWRDEVPAEQIELVRRGYLAQRPSFYTEASDW